MSARRPGPVLRWLLRAPALLYRAHAGWLLGRRFLLLTHVGRRSGRQHQTVLELYAGWSGRQHQTVLELDAGWCASFPS